MKIISGSPRVLYYVIISTFFSNSISTINNVVSEDLESLKTWLGENKLSLNVAKTHCILIGSRNKIRALNQSNTTMPSIYIGHDKVSSLTSIKHLRVQVDQYLNWEEHLLTILSILFIMEGIIGDTIQFSYASQKVYHI